MGKNTTSQQVPRRTELLGHTSQFMFHARCTGFIADRAVMGQ